MSCLEFVAVECKVGVRLYSIVGALLLVSQTTYLFLLNKVDLDTVLHQQCCTV